MSVEPAAADGAREVPHAVRSHRLAVTLLVILATLLVASPLIRGEVFVFRDHLDYFQPLRYHTSTLLKSGEFPLWNPYSASGEPWFANPQTAVFYPPAFVFLLLPFATAYVLYILLHLLLLAVGAYFLFRRTASEGAALAGAVVLLVCGPTLSLADTSNNLTTFAWLPVVLYVALERVRPQVAGAVLALTFLAGEPFFAALFALFYVVIVRSPREVAETGLVAFGLSAVQLLPFLEMLRGSDRAHGLDIAELFRDSAAFSDWLRLVLPPRIAANGADAALAEHFIPIVYLGMVTVALAVLGVATVIQRRVGRAWLGMFLFALVVSVGPAIPPIGFLLLHSPVTLFRYPARLIPVGAFAVVALMVCGWERLRPKSRWADLVLVLLVLIDLVPRTRHLLVSAPFNPRRITHAAEVGRDSKVVRLGMRYGLDRDSWIAGYTNLFDRRFDASSAAPVTGERYRRYYDVALSTPDRMDLFNLLPAKWVLTDRPIAPRFPKTGQVGSVSVYENRRALPMASLWSGVGSARDADEALDKVLRKRALLVVSPPSPRATRGAAEVREVHIEKIDSSQVRLIVDSPTGGVVVLTQQDAEGWNVAVDGTRVAKRLANGIFRAVDVPAGRHEVVWTYRPLTFFLGAAMTIITLGSLQLAAFVKRRRKQNFSS